MCDVIYVTMRVKIKIVSIKIASLKITHALNIDLKHNHIDEIRDCAEHNITTHA